LIGVNGLLVATTYAKRRFYVVQRILWKKTPESQTFTQKISEGEDRKLSIGDYFTE